MTFLIEVIFSFGGLFQD